MKIEADFTKVSSSFEQLAEETYRFRIEEIKMGEEKSGSQTPLLVVSKVVGGDRADTPFTDFIYLKKKDGTANANGQGRVKAYAEAVLGEEAANNPSGLELDDLLQGTFDGIIKHESYEKKDPQNPAAPGEQKIAARLVKILKAS